MSMPMMELPTLMSSPAAQSNLNEMGDVVQCACTAAPAQPLSAAELQAVELHAAELQLTEH